MTMNIAWLEKGPNSQERLRLRRSEEDAYGQGYTALTPVPAMIDAIAVTKPFDTTVSQGKGIMMLPYPKPRVSRGCQSCDAASVGGKERTGDLSASHLSSAQIRDDLNRCSAPAWSQSHHSSQMPSCNGTDSLRVRRTRQRIRGERSLRKRRVSGEGWQLPKQHLQSQYGFC